MKSVVKGKGGGNINISDGVMLLTRPLHANRQVENNYHAFSEYAKESLVGCTIEDVMIEAQVQYDLVDSLAIEVGSQTFYVSSKDHRLSLADLKDTSVITAVPLQVLILAK